MSGIFKLSKFQRKEKFQSFFKIPYSITPKKTTIDFLMKYI